MGVATPEQADEPFHPRARRYGYNLPLSGSRSSTTRIAPGRAGAKGSALMRLPQPFIKLPFAFDHHRLAQEIAQFDESEWRPHPQRFEGNSSLVLVSTQGGENDDFRGPMKPTDRLQRTPYLRQVMASFDSVIGRSRLMRLAPGASVSEHVDGHYFWRNHLRIHVPILTEPEVAFQCGAEQVHMAAGESWTFDNWLLHAVHNRSDKARIHLVIDTVGSASLWKWIRGEDAILRRVEPGEGDGANLRFEEFLGLPVMPPAELGGDLSQLVDDIDPSSPDGSRVKQWLSRRTEDFVHEWECHWVQHGPTVAGFPKFRGLREALQREIDQLPEGITLASNGYSLKIALTYTLDSSLSPDSLAAAPGAAPIDAPNQRPRFDRPVFIVSAPRSGSTLLFETLAANRELWSLGDEGHACFEEILSAGPEPRTPECRLTAQHATPEVVDRLLTAFEDSLINSSGSRLTELSPLSRPTEIRLLDRTPANALCIPFLARAFPDARFVFLLRDARKNIASLLESWQSGRYVTHASLPGWPQGRSWSHLLIPGWQKLGTESLAQTAATQWLTINRIIIDDLRELPRERWCAVDLDDFLADPRGELQRLCQFAQIIFGPRMQQISARPLMPTRHVLSPPRPDKWQGRSAEIEPVLPAVEPLMATLKSLTSGHA